MRHSRRLTILCGIGIAILCPSSAYAFTNQWPSDTEYEVSSIDISKKSVRHDESLLGCIVQDITLTTESPYGLSANVVPGCVKYEQAYSIASYIDAGSIGIAIRFSTEWKYKPIENVKTNKQFALIKGRDLLSLQPVNAWWKIMICHDFQTKLEVSKQSVTGDVLSYKINDACFKNLIQDTASRNFNDGTVRGIVLSDNGKWLAIDYSFYGLWKYNVDTGASMIFALSHGSEFAGMPVKGLGAISDDGNYVFNAIIKRIYTANDTCGADLRIWEQPPDPSGASLALEKPCSFVRLDTMFRNDQVSTDYRFSHDDSWLEASNGMTFSVFRKKGHYTESLSYLAMGDSYSSGEGDVGKDQDGKSHYLAITDDLSNNCHISARSYPFLLKSYWHIADNDMHSVACSGAKILPDYVSPLGTYRGQNERLGANNVDTRQESAIMKFIPGYVPQMEFIKRYHPKVVTLTGGGNDVGFADMLAYCAYGSGDINTLWGAIREGFFGLATCSYAQPNSVTQRLALKVIDEQYERTRYLLSTIKAISPETKVYVIGYPSFISEGTAVCLNSLELNAAERETIQYLLLRLNQQLAQAARDENINYVDIQNSIKGGRLCEGSEYVTGIQDIDIRSERQNIFHPNAAGHVKIAQAIRDNLDASYVLDALNPPASVSDSPYDGTVERHQITQSDIPKNGTIKLSADSGTFAASSRVRASLHSEIIDLGTYTTNKEGGVEVSIAVSNLPSGFHLLTLEGVTPSNEKVQLYQSVTVGLEEDTTASETTPSIKKGTSSGQLNFTGDIQVVEPQSSVPGSTKGDISKSGGSVMQESAVGGNVTAIHGKHTPYSTGDPGNRPPLLFVVACAVMAIGTIGVIMLFYVKSRRKNDKK